MPPKITSMDLNALQSLLPTTAVGLTAGRTSPTTTSGLEVSEFQKIFNNMLSSSGVAGTTGANLTSGADPFSSSGSSLMMPLMFAMMEKLLAKQMELLQSGKLAAPLATAAETAPVNTQTQTNELKQPAILVANQRLREQREQLDQAALTGQVQPQSGSAVLTGNPTNAVPHGQPVQGGRLTQGYHSGHNGLDFGIVVGTPVHSSMEGKVIYAGWNTIGYGNLVIVQNGDYQTYYAHLSKIPVTVGQTVTADSVIGYSGNTGNSTGPHLHYEIRYKGKNVDPTAVTLNKAI